MTASLFAVKRKLIYEFREAGLDTPELDARILLETATGLSAADMIARSQDPVPTEVHTALSAMVQRRLGGEPIDHILGYREFYGRRFDVNSDVLSPRPETEDLVSYVVNQIKSAENPYVLDLGTGSGAIIISVLAESEHARGVAVELSDTALDTAKANAARHNVSSRCQFYQGSWFDALPEGQALFDVIVSNPPYITDAMMTDLDDEVQNFDPDLALRGGTDGLDAYREIISKAQGFLSPHGWLVCEIGYDQGASVSELMRRHNYADVDMWQDLSGHDRYVKGRKFKL